MTIGTIRELVEAIRPLTVRGKPIIELDVRLGMAVRDAEEMLAIDLGALVAPAPVPASGGASPDLQRPSPGLQRSSRRAIAARSKAGLLGGLPGPMQFKVLEALNHVGRGGQIGLTGSEIAKAAGIEWESSVYGCTSGMMNMRNRHWVRFTKHNDDNDPEPAKGRSAAMIEPNTRKRRWYITDRGRQVLELARTFRNG